MRILSLALALAGSMTLSGFAAQAQAPGGYYTAVAVVAPGKSTLMTRSTPWKCEGTTCTAARAPERTGVLCELVAQRVGKLESFTVGGAALDAPSLEKCNARAK